MEPTPTLLCIPDISGFTNFMSNTAIEVSAKVIPSLLNNIIYSNQIGLKVSEIEGDAVLFYKVGPLPPFEDLIDQCRYFFTEFYAQLKAVMEKYNDHKEVPAIDEVLGLKIIVHFGEDVVAQPIGKNIKLMGEDVILAHRLLKNKIEIKEYLLLSAQLLDQYPTEEINANFTWSQVHEKDTTYKHLGAVNYSYINLKPLLDH